MNDRKKYHKTIRKMVKMKMSINDGTHICPKCGYDNFHHEMFYGELSCNRCCEDFTYKEILKSRKT